MAAEEVDEVILGQVLMAGQGQNPARQATLNAGCRKEAIAWGVNQVCGSGLRAVALGMQQIAAGDAGIVVAGGQESMSQAPHCHLLRLPPKMGPVALVDTMMNDGLTSTRSSLFHGVDSRKPSTQQFGISPPTRRRSAFRPRRPSRRRERGRFDAEIVSVPVSIRKKETVVARDEHIRPDTSLEALARLRPAFSETGTVTAGNSSGINDAAAALVLMSEEEALRRGIAPLARIASWASAGVDPALMGTGPDSGIPARAGKGRLEQ